MPRAANSGTWTKGHSPHNKLDPEEKQRRLRDRNRRKYFGLSEEEYQSRKSAQGPICAVCREVMDDKPREGKRITGRAAVLDHNHATRKARKFIHSDCNVALGLFKENPVTLRLAAEYLEKENAI